MLTYRPHTERATEPAQRTRAGIAAAGARATFYVEVAFAGFQTSVDLSHEQKKSG